MNKIEREVCEITEIMCDFIYKFLGGVLFLIIVPIFIVTSPIWIIPYLVRKRRKRGGS